MRKFPIPQNKAQRVILILFLIAVVVVRLNQIYRPAQDGKDLPQRKSETANAPRTAQPPPSPKPNTNPQAPKPRSGWKTFEKCTLAEHRNNDGDSFDLMCGGQKMTVRLYFVDCPEKRRHQYNGDRIADQARYFDCSEDQALETGLAAKDFAEGFLRNDSVTFTTKMEPVYDSERIYGFVSVGGQDMGEALVSRGLARIHTKGVDGPNPGGEREEKDRLYKMEREAKTKKLGGWMR